MSIMNLRKRLVSCLCALSLGFGSVSLADENFFLNFNFVVATSKCQGADCVGSTKAFSVFVNEEGFATNRGGRSVFFLSDSEYGLCIELNALFNKDEISDVVIGFFSSNTCVPAAASFAAASPKWTFSFVVPAAAVAKLLDDCGKLDSFIKRESKNYVLDFLTAVSGLAENDIKVFLDDYAKYDGSKPELLRNTFFEPIIKKMANEDLVFLPRFYLSTLEYNLKALGGQVSDVDVARTKALSENTILKDKVAKLEDDKKKLEESRFGLGTMIGSNVASCAVTVPTFFLIGKYLANRKSTSSVVSSGVSVVKPVFSARPAVSPKRSVKKS